MDSLLRIALSNAACAAVLALLAAAVSRTLPRRPALAHALWLLVLLKLLTPAMWTFDLPSFGATAAPAAGDLPAPALLTTDHPVLSDSTRHHHPRPNVSISLVVVAIWAAGSTVCAAVVIIRLIRFERILRYATAASGADASTGTGSRFTNRAAVASPPVLFLPGQVCPMLFSVFAHARILLPCSLWDRLSAAQQSRLLAHELAHLRRGDHWVRFCWS